MRRLLRASTLAVAFGLFSAAIPAGAADHKDAPLISEDKSLDMLDVFAFQSPTNADQTVLAMTVNGFAVPGELNLGFATNALYEFKIDNTGDHREDIVIQFTFNKVGAAQQFTMRGPAAPRRVGPTSQILTGDATLTGPANGTEVLTGDSEIRVFAGTRDDPFYTDLIWVVRQIGASAGGPLARAKGIDFLAGLNCTVLAVQLPRELLTTGGTTGNSIKVWGTTSRPNQYINSFKKDPVPLGADPVYVQIERTAVPALNTIINSALTNPGRKDGFNRTPPHLDVQRYRQIAIDAITTIGVLDSTEAAALVDLALIPDVLTLDVTSAAGFPNGRAPSDDIIDTILTLASDGAITDDGVDNNDVAFENDFPFFGLPHTAAEGVPARDQ